MDSKVAANSKRWSLAGMTALVTGGTKGIGHAIVEELVGLGAKVHTCARSKAELDACLKDWKSRGLSVTGSICDVSSRPQREQLMEAVKSTYAGNLNILVNNAGGAAETLPTATCTKENYDYILSANFESAYHLTQLAYPMFKASKSGSVVFISSIAGIVAFDMGSLYGPAKAALHQLAKILACEWANDNIRVNCVAPGPTFTPSTESLFSNEEVAKCFNARIPLGRPGLPNEIASVAAFLLCPQLRMSPEKLWLLTEVTPGVAFFKCEQHDYDFSHDKVFYGDSSYYSK